MRVFLNRRPYTIRKDDVATKKPYLEVPKGFIFYWEAMTVPTREIAGWVN